VSYINNNTAGQILFGNSRIRTYFAIVLTPPPGATFAGNSAEWILEVPGGEQNSSLPKFTPVTFNLAAACNPTTGVSCDSGDTLNIETAEALPEILTATTFGENYSVTIDYIG
jgi:hypothetical protein